MLLSRFAKNSYERFKDLIRLPIALFVLATTVLIVASYAFYFPPNFNEGFLAGRSHYFYATPYAIGFYAHIVGAPVGLVAGTLQMNKTILRRLPYLHRTFGRITIFSTLLLASPGGLIMAFGTHAGRMATLCFVLMSLLTSWFAWMAWRTAVMKNWSAHRHWAWRCYLMLASAIVLRVIDPILRDAGVPDLFSYRFSIWLSWLPALLLFEVLYRKSPS